MRGPLVLEPGLPAIIAMADSAAPLIVCVPGSGYDARYFDLRECSFLDRLVGRGHSAVSVTRPGYPADEVSALVRPSFAQSAAVLDDAIADAWSRFAGDSSGVVVLGHSVGGAIALHLAARNPSWPLSGVAVSGVGDRPADSAVEYFAHIPADRPLSMSFDAVRRLFYGPADTVDEAVVPHLAGLLVPMPSGDPVEVNTTWPADLPAVASAVGVPVFHAFAGHERLWETGPSRQAAFTGLFARAPFVESHVVEGCGHNIEHHRVAGHYADLVSAFALRCVG